MTRRAVLEVRWDDHVVGRIERREGRLAFAYDDRWRHRPDATPISLSMPLAAQRHAHQVVEPYLWGLLPDDDRVLQRWGREFGVTTSHPLGLLAAVGDDLPGAMRMVDPEADRWAPHDSIEWLSDDDVAELLGQVREDRTAWLGTGSPSRWSLAGAQPKIALLEDADGRWGRPRGRVATNRILKPAIVGFEDHDLNEHLCLDAAARLGLRSVRSRVVSFGDERAIVVERYDRRSGDDGSLRRIHQEDLCQSLGVHPAHKYESDGGPGAIDVISLLRSTVETPTATAQAVTAFVDAQLFGWLIAAPDAHAKNFSVLLSGPQVRLAPLYDVASALPYPDTHDTKVKLAMRFGRYYRVSAIGARAWQSFAADAGLDADAVLHRAEALATQAADAFADSVASLADGGVRSRLPATLLDRVARRAASCAELLR